MKGFVKVGNQKVSRCIQNHLNILEQTKIIRENAIFKYYEKYYESSSWWTRWVNRKSTPERFFYNTACDNWFLGYDHYLDEFLTDNEVKILSIIKYGDKDKREGLQALLNNNQGLSCQLGEEYCEYIERYKDIKQ